MNFYDFVKFSDSIEETFSQYYQIEDKNSVSIAPIHRSLKDLAVFLNTRKAEIRNEASRFNYASYFYTLERIKRALSQAQFGLASASLTSKTFFFNVFVHIHTHEGEAIKALQASGKLPVSYGKQFSETIQEWEEELDYPTSKSLRGAQKEAFHHLSLRQTGALSGDFIEYVTGWNNPRATFSILKAIQTHALQSHSDFNYSKLEADIQRSLSFAHKHHRADELFANQSPQQKQMGMETYYGHIGKIFPYLLQLEEAGFKNLDFLDDRELLAEAQEKFPDFDWPFLLMSCLNAHAVRNNWMPTGVILLDILQDMRQGISQLQEGEQLLYPLGSCNHLLLCKIKRESSDHFSFTLYNPGDHVEETHRVRFTEEAAYAQAFRLTDLPLEAVNDSNFLSNLLHLSIQAEDMVLFYQTVQEHLVQNHCGKTVHSTKWFKLPNQGICSVACWDMFLQDELPRNDYSQFKMHKTSVSIQKLSHVITCYSEITKSTSDTSVKALQQEHLTQVRKMHHLAQTMLIDF